MRHVRAGILVSSMMKEVASKDEILPTSVQQNPKKSRGGQVDKLLLCYNRTRTIPTSSCSDETSTQHAIFNRLIAEC